VVEVNGYEIRPGTRPADRCDHRGRPGRL